MTNRDKVLSREISPLNHPTTDNSRTILVVESIGVLRLSVAGTVIIGGWTADTQRTILTVFLPVFDRFCSARLKMPLVHRSDHDARKKL